MNEADRLLSEVRSVFADLHGGRTATVTLQSDLAGDLGLDSLAVVELHDRLEGAFGVTLSPDVLATAATPGDWLQAIFEARGEAGHARTDVPVAPPAVRPAGGIWPEGARTLTEALEWHVEQHPDLVSVRLLGSHGQSPTEELSYRTLAHESTTLACGLVDEGLRRGERVAIMLPTGRDYFMAFLGTILGGGVPVPIYPPANPSVLEQHLDRQTRLLENAGASVLIAEPEARAKGANLCSRVSSLRAVRTPGELSEAGRRPHQLPDVGADDTALIQYTSGSTSDPKGVVLSHTHVLANVHSLGQAVDVSTDDVFVSWLPLYHDMGLIGAWHASLVFGFPLVLLSPLQFLARPASWLEAISAHSGTLSAAPNFAYQSCVDRIRDEELDGLDLSSWRAAFNGSEPVSALTVERFAARFDRCGFRRQTMCPAYGLAEVGVGLTLTPLGRGPSVDVLERGPLQRSGEAIRAAPGDANTVAVVGCGMVAPGYTIRVTDAHGGPLPDLREGRIQCRGPSASSGYFNNDAASRSLWSQGWLETGDLGYLRAGELFLTGRAKDLVIRGGRNLHPEDLEQALGELEGVDPNGVAVFASADPRRGTERIVVVIETGLEERAAQDALRNRVGRTAAEVVGAAPDEIVLVPGGSILRTTSLKIRRGATREAFEAGLLSPAATATALPHTAADRWHRQASDRGLREAVASWAFGAYVWVLLGLIGLPLWFAVQLPMGRRRRWALTRAGGRSLLVLAGIHLKVQGNFSHDGPVVIVANHSSFVDALALMLALPEPVVFVTSSDMEHRRFVGSFLRRLGCAFVHRGHADRGEEDVKVMADLIRAGHHLVIFPEGSITPVVGLRPFHLGAFAVATASGCPVVPIGIRGTRDIVRPGTYLPHHGAAAVTIGLPVMPDGGGFTGEVDLSHRVRHAVAELSQQLEIDR
jgi:1-acyl-sn-glycerol-3-phosphate acyltransferase